MNDSDLSIHVAWFDRALERGSPACGTPETLSWHDFTTVFRHRRIGEKDGCCFVPARFKLQPGGKQVRRLKANVISRTAIALDFELNKTTGEIPPSPITASRRVKSKGWACIIYSSHSHQPPCNIRYRIVLPLSDDLAAEIPAPEIVAETLELDGVLDRSKIVANSVFYTPSKDSVYSEQPHFAQRMKGDPIDSTWLIREGEARLAAKEAEAQAEAAVRLAAKTARGLTEEESLIERINQKLDLQQILLSHGYTKHGTRYLNPESSSKMAGGKVLDGERYYTFNASDSLHEDNLPAWCDVRAVDAFDAIAILAFSADRKRALRELAARHGLSKTQEKKQLAAMVFKWIRDDLPQLEIVSLARAGGAGLCLTDIEIVQVVEWVNNKIIKEAA